MKGYNLIYLFVNFTYLCGDKEFQGHTIISGRSKNNEDIVHKYFCDFYGKNSLDKDFIKARKYYYDDYEKGVKIDNWTRITKKEKELLNVLGVH